ncbi:protein kinase [Fusarium austroafricanum]|uniref:Protein kinase n=1 Tax=Fusarium austroafricanum TaxID=2364996 RepID=A0A8H4JFP8_9HYPO|nr:protein kinase [Fusarium austroafricanum]
MADALGTVLGVAGLIAAFKGAVDGYMLLEAFFDDDTGCGYLSLRYHIEKHKLGIWGDFFKTSDPATCTLTKQPDVVKHLILRILGEIKKTHEDAEPFIKKHHLSEAKIPVGDVDKSLQPNSKMAQQIAAAASQRKTKGRISWIIGKKDKFAELVTRLQQLNRDLYDILQPADIDLLQKALSSYVLAQIKGTNYVQMLQDPKAQSPRLLALSAQLMDLQQKTGATGKTGVISIQKESLTLKHQKWTTGLYKDADGLTHSIWIEWTTLEPTLPSYATLRARAESLTVTLQTVNEPSLRIPPCCGTFDDLAFEAIHGIKRLGTVFTVPEAEGYEENLRQFEPTTLKQLLRASRNSPPLLGDRFKLAYALVSAFSLFHAAGWLHKGFRSENIVFLHGKCGRGISIAKPLITGFQYSRTQDERSLEQNKVQDAEVEYYYHAEAAGGFTKRLDLYSLGVVLCEVGRWELLADSIPPTEREKLKRRDWATKFITRSPLADLGWRMGERYRDVVRTLLTLELPNDNDEFFAHEFLSKVIIPIESCKV